MSDSTVAAIAQRSQTIRGTTFIESDLLSTIKRRCRLGNFPEADFWPGMIEEPVAKPESGGKSRNTVWNQTSESRAEGGLALKTSGRARQPLPARLVSRSGIAGRLHFRPQ